MVEGIDIIVPVMRLGMADQFMRSLNESGAENVVVTAVADEWNTPVEKEWLAAFGRDPEAGVCAAHHTAMPQKVNHGFRETGQPWVLFVGEDVRFHPGWQEAAMRAAGDRFHVVGTNDLGHPRVISGEHATHMLLRRTYVDEFGGGWDEPGVVMHEGYRHWFADDEIVHAAKQRNAWVAAPGCVIEHLHPAWGKAKSDSVYELGASAQAHDTAVFTERLARFGGSR